MVIDRQIQYHRMVFLTIIILGLFSSNITHFVLTQADASFALQPHAPIEIISDYGFVSLGFLGNGTVSNPYIIENYTIFTSEPYGIYITSTTISFEIRFCVVQSSGVAIVLNVEGDFISINNNVFETDNGKGIYSFNSSNVRIEKNSCKRNEIGIHLSNVDECIIQENRLADNSAHGLFLDEFCERNLIFNNSFLANNIDGNSQGYDDGEANYWYDSAKSLGNQWSD